MLIIVAVLSTLLVVVLAVLIVVVIRVLVLALLLLTMAIAIVIGALLAARWMCGHGGAWILGRTAGRVNKAGRDGSTTRGGGGGGGWAGNGARTSNNEH